MGKSKNRKNKTPDKHSTTESETSDSPSPKPVITKKTIKTEGTTTDNNPSVKVSDKKPAEKKKENTEERPEECDEDNAVDRALATAQRLWKLWAVMGLVAGGLAVLGQTEVAEQDEHLVVDKGVALLVSRPTVFKYIGDLNNYRRWYPGVAKFDATDATPMGIGKHFTEIIQVPLYGDLFYDNVIVGYESPRYISFLSDSWMQTRVEIQVTRRDSPKIPTALQYRIYARAKTVFDKYIVLPCMGLIYRNQVRQAMFNIRFVFAK